MLYATFRLLFRITFRIFFREAVVHGRNRVPAQGPLLICANHPGALLDPMVLAALLQRRVHFLAKAVVFKGKLAQWLLPKFNMIPIYRKQDDPTQLHKNEETFAQCYKHLANGAAILIFPEGISITERKLRELKTGAARIALGAEAANNFSLGIQVLAIGINYDDPHTFRRDVFINVAEPIAVSDYTEHFKAEGFAAAEALTNELRLRLEAQIIHIENDEDDRLIHQLERLYGAVLRRNLELPDVSAVDEFQVTKRLAQTVRWFRTHNPEHLQLMRQQIGNYFWKVEELGLSDKIVRGNRRKRKPIAKQLIALLRTVLGFPVYVYGFLVNALPFSGASQVAQRLVKSREFQGAIGAVAGAVFFLVWYTALAFGVWHYTHSGWVTLAAVLSWIPAGLFAWYYHRTLRTMARRWLLRGLFVKRQSLVAQLIAQREEIIRQLDAAAQQYRAAAGRLNG